MKHVIGHVDEFPDGGHRIVTVASRSIGIFRQGERFYALRNRCPHQGGPLCEGPVQPWVDATGPGEVQVREGQWRVACPWHNWEYDLASGESWFDPRRSRVRAYDVTVEAAGDAGCPVPPDGDGGLVRGPYTAETFPVDVAGDRVVLDLSGGRRR